MTLRRGETLLLTVGIPVVFLVFFSRSTSSPTGTAKGVTFLSRGSSPSAVMSTAMVSLGIATGFERGYGVLKRLGATPLRRSRLLGAKTITIIVVELVQAAVLLPVGIGLGWRPSAVLAPLGAALAVVLLATVGLRRPRPAPRRGAAGRGQPGRGQRALPRASCCWAGWCSRCASCPVRPGESPALLPAAALSGGLHASLGNGAAVPAESGWSSASGRWPPRRSRRRLFRWE